MRALIAMSGGVDSSVAALLTQEAGLDCIGCTMRLFVNEDAGIERQRSCCSIDDVDDARAVAYRLGMPFYVFNFSDAFRESVIHKFVSCYQRGITPNPCIDCNRYMKFERLFARADDLQCDGIVTGHYARIEQRGGTYLLKKALDPTKDQSYVLYSMTQAQLAKTRFPLGALTKAEVRQIAQQHGFRNAGKPDSQDICFVPDGDYAKIVELHGGSCPKGDFVDQCGAVLGQPKGIIHYTVGQRRGLGIPSDGRLYVTGINADKNQVILGTERQLLTDTVYVSDVHWISGVAPQAPFSCTARLRYRQPEKLVTVHPLSDTQIQLVFAVPQRAPAPGQAAVLYQDDVVLGGGVIEKPL